MYTVYIYIYMCVYQLHCSLWVIALHYIPFHSMTYIHKHTNATVYVYMILWFWILKIWYNGMVFSLLLFFLFVSWYQIKVIYLAILWYMLNNVDSVACTYIQYIYIYTYGIVHTVYTIHPCMNHHPATPSWSRPRWWCRRTRRGHAGSRHPSAHPWHWMKWWLKTLLENGENGGFK